MALKQLPPDLDQTYDNILLSVRPADHEYLRRALQFVVFSARPMTMVEVAEAVIVEPGMLEVDEDARKIFSFGSIMSVFKITLCSTMRPNLVSNTVRTTKCKKLSRH